jgi:hypothetical protein
MYVCMCNVLLISVNSGDFGLACDGSRLTLLCQRVAKGRLAPGGGTVPEPNNKNTRAVQLLVFMENEFCNSIRICVIIYLEAGDKVFCRNVGTDLQYYTV